MPPAEALPVLWTADVAAAATDGHATRDWRAVGVSIDSRSVKQNELFVALKGPNFDGHDFVAVALKAGAAAALVHRVPGGLAVDAPAARSSTTACAGWRRSARPRADAAAPPSSPSPAASARPAPRRCCAWRFGASGATYASTGNLNNQWGVPLRSRTWRATAPTPCSSSA